MAVIGLPRQPVDLRDLAKQGVQIPFLAEPPDTEIHTFLAHEQGDPLLKVTILRTGKTGAEVSKEIADTIARVKEQGITLKRTEVEDWEKLLLIEDRGKPRGYLCEYQGSAKVLNRWISGEQVESGVGSFEQVSEPHYRTFGPPGFIDIAGVTHIEPMDRAKFEEHYRKTGMFSSLTWLEWPEFSKLR
jgi:hypothetical protein